MYKKYESFKTAEYTKVNFSINKIATSDWIVFKKLT